MSTQSILQAALSALHMVFPSALATVTIDGADVTALRDDAAAQGGLVDGGTDAQRTGMVRIRTDLIRALKIGESIKVDGKQVFVTQDNTDAAGVVRHIYYSEQRPYAGDFGPL